MIVGSWTVPVGVACTLGGISKTGQDILLTNTDQNNTSSPSEVASTSIVALTAPAPSVLVLAATVPAPSELVLIVALYTLLVRLVS